MALFKGGLYAGALYAGALWGGADEIQELPTGGGNGRSKRKNDTRPRVRVRVSRLVREEKELRDILTILILSGLLE